MQIGDKVSWEGRLYELLGVDPMSVPEPHAWLADPRTGEQIRVPLESIKPVTEGANETN